MTKARAIELRLLVVLVAALLAAAAVWAGTSWAGGSGERSPPGPTPAQTSGNGFSFSQSDGSSDDRRDCPDKGPDGEGPSSSENAAETAV